MIKFTNDAEAHKGNPIYINPDHIAAVFESPSQPGGSLKTIIFGGPTGVTWEVEESPAEVIKKIKEAKK